ncbi:MAG: phenazine biosynthesis protein [Desulfobacteraceae bacterium]|nr:phenazine biosynthesis protein [Desulfobacteraceae bacterium]
MIQLNSIILYCDDVGLSTKFYEKIIGSKPVQKFDGFSLFQLKDSFMLGLQCKHHIDPKPQQSFGGFELCLGNEDMKKKEVDSIYKEWKKMNILIALEPAWLDFGYTFVALDPDGHRIRICATDTTNIPEM